MYWERIDKGDKRALALADRHYTRQSPRQQSILPPRSKPRTPQPRRKSAMGDMGRYPGRRLGSVGVYDIPE